MCEYRGTTVARDLLACWFPLLNSDRQPVLIRKDLISLEDLTATDGTDLILGELQALWRSDVRDTHHYKKVGSVIAVLGHIYRFQDNLWSSDEYNSLGLDVRISYECRPDKLYDEDSNESLGCVAV